MTAIFLLFLATSLSTGLIVLALIVLTPFLNKRYAVKWKYLIWIFLALRLLVPLGATNGQPVVERLSQTGMQAAAEAEEENADMTAGGIRRAGRVIVELPAEMTTPIVTRYAAESEESNAGVTMLDIAAFVWMTGGLIFISVHVISYVHYKRQVTKKGKIVRDACILRQMSERKRELHIRRKIGVTEYAGAGSPLPRFCV